MAKLITVKKIWSHSPHNAMTDLIYYKDRFLCVFRESDAHVHGENGTIRLLESDDAENWTSMAHFAEEGVDLRDPKLSITPDNRLMLLAGGTIYHDEKYVSMQSRVAFLDEENEWSPFILITEKHEWLWRVTWYENKAYGVSYSFSDKENLKKEWLLKLWESNDGIHYTKLMDLPIDKRPNETTLRFLDDGTMLALVRRDGPIDRKAWFGSSKAPYTDWTWHKMHGYFGGPNFLVLPDQSLIAAGRVYLISTYGVFAHTVLASIKNFDFKVLYTLPSWDDSSYPGLVMHENQLFMSYYSSHEGNTNIYMAKFQL